MKRFLCLLCIVIFSFAFSACNDGGKDSQKYLEILQSGTYSLEGYGVIGGQVLMITQYVDQDTINTTFRNELDTVVSNLYVDGKYYSYDRSRMLYAPLSDTDEIGILHYIARYYDYDTAVYKKSDKQHITGVTYKYDIYSIQTVDGEETFMELYPDPEYDRLYAIAFPNESITFTFADFSPEIDENAFMAIPEDYFEVTPNDITSQIGV